MEHGTHFCDSEWKVAVVWCAFREITFSALAMVIKHVFDDIFGNACRLFWLGYVILRQYGEKGFYAWMHIFAISPC